MNRSALLLAALLLAALPSPFAAAQPMPPFAVEAGDGVVRFDDVVIRDHEDAGATLFEATAVNRTGCDFGAIEIDLVFVAGEGDRIHRLSIENFRDGAAVPVSRRRVPGPRQEVQSIRGISVLGPMACAKAIAEEKRARELKALALKKKAEEEAAARKRSEEDAASRIAAVRAKRFGAGFADLFLGMSPDDIRALSQDDAFPWKAVEGDSGSMLLECRAETRCDLGRDAPREGGAPCRVKTARIGFAGGKSVSLAFRSPTVPASRIEPELGEWGERACRAVSSRYGNPTRVSKPFGKIRARELSSGKPLTCASWKRDGETLRIAASAGEDGYGMTVSVEERAGGKAGPGARKRRP